MNIALNGSYKDYKGGRGNFRTREASYVEKELYYNCDYNKDTYEDDEHPKKRFCFLSKEKASSEWFKINQLVQFNNLDDCNKYLSEKNLSENAYKDLSLLFERLNASEKNGLIHYYCIKDKSYDDALDIFVRVNSTGTKLSKTDLLFSTLINGWKDGKENINKILKKMNENGDKFQFTIDYLMRLSLVLVDANPNLKINSLTKTTTESIKNNWQRIENTVDTLSTVLADIGMYNEIISSYNATMPIAYYLYKGGVIKDDLSKKEIKKFLAVSFAKQLFSLSSNYALTETRKALKNIDCKKTKFSLKLFESVIFTGGQTFKVNEEQIDNWLNNYKYEQRTTYILLSLLYSNYKLSQVSFDIDHCHPSVAFEDKNIKKMQLSEEKINEWKFKRNLLPNLQFLKDSENESDKKDRPLKKWVEDGNDFEYHPVGVSLELKDFDDFFEKRKNLMKNKLKEIFDVK